LIGMDGFTAPLLFFWGVAFGGFFGVVHARRHEGGPWWKTLLRDSQCDHCHAPLSWRDKVPLLGWLQCAGRSRCCGWRVPFRYFVYEMLFGLFLSLGYLAAGWLVAFAAPVFVLGLWRLADRIQSSVSEVDSTVTGKVPGYRGARRPP